MDQRIIKAPVIQEAISLASGFNAPSIAAAPAGVPAIEDEKNMQESTFLRIPTQPLAQPIESILEEQDSNQAPETKDKLTVIDEERLLKLAEEARLEGYAQGTQNAKSDVADEFDESISRLKDILKSSQQSIQEYVAGSEKLIASIIFETVCKIIGDRLASYDGCKEYLLHVIRNVHRDDIVTIKVAPQDYALLMDKMSMDVDLKSQLSALNLEPDRSIKLGGAVIQLKEGLVDARIDEQLELLAHSLKEMAVYGR